MFFPKPQSGAQTSDRGTLGRRQFLAMFVGLSLPLLGVGLAALAGPMNGSDEVRTRGNSLPLHRQEALAGALQMERPACPTPSRVSGDLEILILDLHAPTANGSEGAVQ